MDTPQESNATGSRWGVRVLFALGATWLLGLVSPVLVYVTPLVVPNCRLGGKVTTTDCGMLTPILDGTLEFVFEYGLVLVVLTLPWLVVGIVIAIAEERNGRASA